MSRISLPAVLILLLCVSVGSWLYAEEFQLHTLTTGDQETPAVAVDGNGNFVVVWADASGDGSGFGILARRYDADGTPEGDPFPVNTNTTDDQVQPAVSVNASGEFVVVWASYGEDGDEYGIFGQRFTSAAAPDGGQFQVNNSTIRNQFYPSVSLNDGGDFVVVWDNYTQTYYPDVFARRYDDTGTAMEPEFLANTFTTYFQGNSDVALDGTGTFMVVWESGGYSDYDVVARRFDSALGATGELQVNTYYTGDQSYPAIAQDGSGNFVVVWANFPGGPTVADVSAMRFTNTGALLTDEIQVNTYTTSTQRQADVAAAGSNEFIVTWSSYGQDGSAYGVFAQQFDSDANPDGDAFQVNTYTTDDQTMSSVAMASSEEFVVVWESDLQDGSGTGVYGTLAGEDTANQPSVAICGTTAHYAWVSFDDGGLNRNIDYRNCDVVGGTCNPVVGLRGLPTQQVQPGGGLQRLHRPGDLGGHGPGQPGHLLQAEHQRRRQFRRPARDRLLVPGRARPLHPDGWQCCADRLGGPARRQQPHRLQA